MLLLYISIVILVIINITGNAQVYQNKIVYDTKDYVNDYDETVITNTLNEHANAAFRYFHTNIVGNLK